MFDFEFDYRVTFLQFPQNLSYLISSSVRCNFMFLMYVLAIDVHNHFLLHCAFDFTEYNLGKQFLVSLLVHLENLHCSLLLFNANCMSYTTNQRVIHGQFCSSTQVTHVGTGPTVQIRPPAAHTPFFPQLTSRWSVSVRHILGACIRDISQTEKNIGKQESDEFLMV